MIKLTQAQARAVIATVEQETKKAKYPTDIANEIGERLTAIDNAFIVAQDKQNELQEAWTDGDEPIQPIDLEVDCELFPYQTVKALNPLSTVGWFRGDIRLMFDFDK